MKPVICTCGRPMERKRANDGERGWLCYDHAWKGTNLKGRWVSDEWHKALEKERKDAAE